MSRATSPTDPTTVPDVVVNSPQPASRSKSVKARTWLQRKMGRSQNGGLSTSSMGEKIGSSGSIDKSGDMSDERRESARFDAESDSNPPVLRTAGDALVDSNHDTNTNTDTVKGAMATDTHATPENATSDETLAKMAASRSTSVPESGMATVMGSVKKNLALTPRSKSVLKKPSLSQDVSASSLPEESQEDLDSVNNGRSSPGFRSGVMERIRRAKRSASPGPRTSGTLLNPTSNSSNTSSLTPGNQKSHALQQNVGFGKLSNSMNSPRNTSQKTGGSVLSINSMTILPGRSPSMHSRTRSAETSNPSTSASLSTINAKRSTSMLANLKESERLDSGFGRNDTVENGISEEYGGVNNVDGEENTKSAHRETSAESILVHGSNQGADWGYRAAIAAFFLTLFLATLREVGLDVVPKIMDRTVSADDIATLKSRLAALKLELPSKYEIDESEKQLKHLHEEIIKTRRKQQFLIKHEVSPYVSINMILKDSHSFGDGRVFNDTLDMLKLLDYPKQRLSFNVLISDHEFYEMAASTWPAILSEFHNVHVTHCDYGWTTGRSDRERHGASVQKKRRSMLAKYRNILYMRTRYNDYRTLNNTVVDHISTNRRRKTSHYVLWLDADIEHVPPTIISDLIGSGKHVITPRCMRENLDYDLNTWAGDRIEATRPSQYRHLLFVPYPGSLNRNMRDFAESGEEYVEVDSVGGTALLVRSDVHDQGALFPPFPIVGAHPTTLGGYDGIETEGLCYVAKAAGVKCWGAPQVVIHHNYYD